MQTGERKQIAFNLNNGAPEQRRKAAEEAVPVLRQEQRRLSEKALRQCREYAATLAAWTSRDAGEARRPMTIEGDLRDARVINLSALCLALTELVLTVVVALVFAVSAPFLLLVALVSIFALKVGVLALWRNPAQPQQTRQRLRRYVIAPALVLTMLSLGALLFARSAGVLALLLLPFINLALCALSLGCLGLAAGLFALGYLMSWSRHAENRFNALEREAVETNKVLQRAEQVAQELRPRPAPRQAVREAGGGEAGTHNWPQVAAPRVPVTNTTLRAGALVRRNGVWLAALVAALAVGGSGCQAQADWRKAFAPVRAASAPPLAPTPALTTALPETAVEETAVETPAGVWLELWLDWSRSAEDQAFAEAVRTLLAALPELALTHDIRRVTAYQFGDRGWSAAEIARLDLPAPVAAEVSEAGVLFKGAQQQQAAQARAQQLAALRQRLAVLTPEKLLPGKAVEPPCTDVRGCLLRIAASARPQRRLVVLITDLDDSCSHQLPALSLATANAALVVVILPELPTASTAFRKTRPLPSPAELWSQRRAELLRAAPGAVAIPYFGEPREAVKQALAKFSTDVTP
ncbi:MAG: hypothetical protein HYR56_33495 [Acidobacteria bacterium]|nr:hypothetical protein [Acidobacteriota bacterium]MBI3424089.1 hypothetical protein [Acidobacteriota bacterium]